MYLVFESGRVQECGGRAVQFVLGRRSPRVIWCAIDHYLNTVWSFLQDHRTNQHLFGAGPVEYGARAIIAPLSSSVVGGLPSDTGSVSLPNFKPTERGLVKRRQRMERRQCKNSTGFGEPAKLGNKKVC